MPDSLSLKLANEGPQLVLPVAENSKRGVLFVLTSRYKHSITIQEFYPVINLDSLNIPTLIH